MQAGLPRQGVLDAIDVNPVPMEAGAEETIRDTQVSEQSKSTTLPAFQLLASPPFLTALWGIFVLATLLTAFDSVIQTSPTSTHLTDSDISDSSDIHFRPLWLQLTRRWRNDICLPSSKSRLSNRRPHIRHPRSSAPHNRRFSPHHPLPDPPPPHRPPLSVPDRPSLHPALPHRQRDHHVHGATLLGNRTWWGEE